MISDERLLPCPFCGGEANCSDYYGEDCIFEYLVICLDCGVSTQTFLTEEEAIEAWNTRKPMERIVERLEEKALEHENNGDRYKHGGWHELANTQYEKSCTFDEAIEIVKKGGGVDEDN